MRRYGPALVAVGLLLVSAPSPTEAAPLRVGSKAFTESVILAELVATLAEAEGQPVERVEGLGGTRLVWEALLGGQIDLYPEYTGTLIHEIFAGDGIAGETELRERLEAMGVGMTGPLGFDNTYVLGMKEERATELGIAKISDLAGHPELRLGFSNEFLDRGDGWPALRSRYGLPHADVKGLEHALAYEALHRGSLDVTDLYATDAKIRLLGLRRLEDDLAHFPEYRAVLVYRLAARERLPAMTALVGAIDEPTMTALNARVELDGLDEAAAAAELLRSLGHRVDAVAPPSIAAEILAHALEHLNMVAVSLLAAILVALPLGVLAARSRRWAQPILAAVGIVQTIPSIALLVLLIRPLSYVSDSLGYPQAVTALFLYSLLPIVRNTHAALTGIPRDLQEAAVALGLPTGFRLARIELPLASRTILAGIKTAAVINIGFATLGGFIGAGGFGEPIFTGIRLNDYGTILQGALPAAALALAAQGLFELLERRVVPRGLRLPSTSAGRG